METSGKLRLVIEELGENALILKLGDRIDQGLSRTAQQLALCFSVESPVGLVDVVPAFASVTLHFDPGEKLPRSRVRAQALAALAEIGRSGTHRAAETSPGPITLDVEYGGDNGIDLESVARFAALDPAAVVARHVAVEYEVAMIGFLPGFAYLTGLDPALAMPRHATPRGRVPAGSVAIGGAQTGIYPSEAPGGWQLIGRTEARLFDPEASEPALLAPGSRVRFRAL